MSKPTWLDEYTTMITDCEKRSTQLSDWETTFVDSLSNQLGKGKMPTPKQVEKLEAIWERVTSR